MLKVQYLSDDLTMFKSDGFTKVIRILKLEFLFRMLNSSDQIFRAILIQMNTILPVAQRGEAILNLIAAPVADAEFSSTWLLELSNAMHSTMLERNGVGIAAPQVYVSKRVIIVASCPNPRYPDAPEMDAIIMVNPEIIQKSDQTVLGEEGCLSVPNERGEVARAESIVVKYQNLKGKEITQEFHGFPARIVQHEIDHLNGVLFVERI